MTDPLQRISEDCVPSTEKVQELTRIRPGHWRNLWFVPEGVISKDSYSGEYVEGPAEALCSERFPSRELAEAHAAKLIAPNAQIPGPSPHYLGAAFFPEAPE